MKNELARTTGTMNLPSWKTAERRYTSSAAHLLAPPLPASQKGVYTFASQAEESGHKRLYHPAGKPGTSIAGTEWKGRENDRNGILPWEGRL